jgi:hypothetical protein
VGILAKRNTEKKAAAATGPVGFDAGDEGWLTAGRPIASAIIHGAALDLDLRAKYSNINRSGHQNMLASGIVGAISSVDTVLWLHDLSNRTWQVSLGAAALDGKVSWDWMCEIRVNPGQVQISTPKYFMKDGTMLKVKLHDQFRAEVFERMAAGRPRVTGNAVGLSQHTFAAAGVGDATVTQFRGTEAFSGSSLVSIDKLTKNFMTGKFGYPPTEIGENRWRYGLGLRGGWDQNWGEIAFEPGAADGRDIKITGSITLTATESRGISTIAAVSAKYFWERIAATLRAEDADVTLVAPPTYAAA